MPTLRALTLTRAPQKVTPSRHFSHSHSFYSSGVLGKRVRPRRLMNQDALFAEMYALFLRDCLSETGYAGPACEFQFRGHPNVIVVSFQCSCQSRRLVRSASHRQWQRSKSTHYEPIVRDKPVYWTIAIRKLADHISLVHSICGAELLTP